MLIGSLVLYGIVGLIRAWLNIVCMVISNPLLICKISFVWFGVFFSMTCLFILYIDRSDCLIVRKKFALHLMHSLGFGFLVASIIQALYSVLFFELIESDFVKMERMSLINTWIMGNQSNVVLFKISVIAVVLAGLHVYFSIGQMLQTMTRRSLVELYGWVVFLMTMLCLGFLFLIAHVV